MPTRRIHRPQSLPAAGLRTREREKRRFLDLLAAAITGMIAEHRHLVNLCLGATASTIGLKVPAILGIGIVTGKPMILGLDPTGMTLLVLTLLLSTLTFSGPRTTVLEGSVHLVLFLVYIVFSDLASNSR
ncbi:MAG: hypothetical protein WBX20_16060 [Terrimicrobiaceae bacterium]